MKVLLVKEDSTESDVIAMAIESLLDGVSVVQVAGPQEAKGILSSGDTYGAIVCENRFSHGESCVEFCRFLSENNLLEHFVLISDVPVEKIPMLAARPPRKLVMRPLEVSELLRAVDETINGEATGKAASQYCKVSINTLMLSDDELKTDLYIRLGEEKFVKALPEGQIFDIEDYNRFLQKNVHHLYVKRGEFMRLLGTWLHKIEGAKDDPTLYSDPARVTDLVASAHSSVQAAIPLGGFTPELQKMAVSSVTLVVKTLQSSPKLTDLMEMLRSRRIPYISAHSVALALISSRLAFMMEWHNERTFFKLAMAAYLHDITLEEDEWARLETREQIKQSGLSEEARLRILNHPIEAARLADLLGENFVDVGNIIEHHHEQSDGSGFPRGATTKEISQIAALFVIAHAIVSEMEKRGRNFSIHNFFQAKENKEKFDRGSFNQIFRTLHTKVEEEEGKA